MAIQQLRPQPTQEKAGEINKFEKKAVAEGNKALRVFEKTYKAGIKDALDDAIDEIDNTIDETFPRVPLHARVTQSPNLVPH